MSQVEGWCLGRTLIFWDQLEEHPCPKNNSITCPKTIKSGWMNGSTKCWTSTWVSAIGFQLIVNEFRKSLGRIISKPLLCNPNHHLSLNTITVSLNLEYKYWVWCHGRSNLYFSFFEPEVTIFVWDGGSREDILIRSDSKPEEKSKITITPLFIVYLTLNGTLIYKLNIVPFRRRLGTRDWDHKLIRKLFTEVINQVRSRVIFS